MISYSEYSSPLGTLLLAASEQGLCGVYFEEHKHFKGPQGWERSHDHPHLQAAMVQLNEYFEGRRTAFDLRLDLRGTEFQQAVWRELLSLPFGHISSYQSIAQCIGRPKAIRAAGTAIGRNPVSIIVPCHRVLGTSGALAGYAGGLERKRHLLAFERERSEDVTGTQKRQKMHDPVAPDHASLVV
ncbi:methylated-DNA--[protein]-cysteine S-methyltransferase [Noviherbaspirillum cavernae]|uniref:Methylated-DNA--protein-cysteine methyltransferase n=1 Tax=Noviherbaspirillum cavernae TaxID=2320862 RepID=A0A418WX26_9BURK|nr:methylated-DNA--[protein]-cysteine S-methyltransferase [Noviherbaspirillum cavernae]RJG04784.1 methylated-DNA--[protein]-cysteine S-methyltransferase [Noviherbaspirillum cavernae]